MDPGKDVESSGRYLVKTGEEYVNGDPNIKKLTFGERDHSKRIRTILLVGETRTGKTTLINSLINYILGMKREEHVWFEISNVNEDDQTPVKTTCISVYEVFSKTSPIAWSIIDTPGYGDTRGPEYDKKIAENLHTLFRSYDGINSIDAVGLVVTACQSCLHERQLYIFDAVQSLFGKNVKTNMVVFITHAEDRVHQNVLTAIEKANIPISKHKNNEPVHFLYDNFQSSNSGSSNSKEYGDIDSAKWEMGQRSTDDFLRFLDTLETQASKMTEDVLRYRCKLSKTVKELQDCITSLDSELENLQNIHEHMERIKAEKEGFQCASEEKVPMTNGCCGANNVLSCTICKENCHLNCYGINNPQKCKVMKNNKCTVCPQRCSYLGHVIETNMYPLKTKEEKENNEQRKREYDRQYQEEEEREKQKEAELTKKRSEHFKLLDKAYKYVMELEKNALIRDSVFTLQHLDFLIERMKKMGNTEGVQKLEELKKIDEQKERALDYFRVQK
ncbi:uncharacterized protein LOC121690139 [Alosa sapidissima]|uniref:uncharacterized protein LOC121690139 n=1 Tax=Alosa sapidissima TaxID=34773 RepID=UPI001C082F86|nr:uncharacterized protein LOC121690139 [Alosa sapidissima]XP_041926478.1 uncharacterized protein LOC121690139 [Alosa sapidissima]XP_041926479.1 uncharacterized protein LOC121690139 [Alosa sapidissima]XP_041926480.1 uncharacterized protein LOC121690139 [Alosa sapidissima]XP_041926481.1 uncharacterized protein LOC121690139 [Alosa sapidissima]